MNENTSSFLKDCAESMEKIIKDLEIYLEKIYVHKININNIKFLKIRHEKKIIALEYLAKIEIKTQMLFYIIPYEKKILQEIYKNIIKCPLLIQTSIAGDKIIIKLPFPTTTQRSKISKNIKKIVENKKIQIRNKRRTYNLKIKKNTKINNKSIEDEKKYIKMIQKLTNKYIINIDKISLKKIDYINNI